MKIQGEIEPGICERITRLEQECRAVAPRTFAPFRLTGRGSGDRHRKPKRTVSGPWGTTVLFGILGSWAISIPFIGWTRAYRAISEFITVASFILLFLIQRSQSKGTLSLQVKLNELLAAAHRASPELINVEDRTESEVQEIHDRFQEIQQRGPGAHSIADVIREEQGAS
jgi:low affinity Fe/Cu permease